MRYVFTDRLGAQSIWNLIDQIAAQLVARGDEVFYYRVDDGWNRPRAAVPRGVEAVEASLPRKTRIWQLFSQQNRLAEAFGRWLQTIRPDVVHTHFCVPGVVARVVARKLGVPTVVSTQHETCGSMYGHYRWAVRWSEPHADAVVYVSQTVANSFGRAAVPWRDQCGGAVPRHLVIPNGIDLAIADHVRRRNALRQPGRLVCAGRLVGGKGHECLLRALRRLHGQFPQASLVLIGEGPREARLRALAAGLGLASAVTFTGALPHEQTLEQMATAEAVVVPSTAPEGFGLVVGEAMAVGTPVVATPIPAFREVYGSANLSLCSAQPHRLAEAIAEILRSPARARGRAERARLWIERRCSADEMAREYLRLYDTLHAKKETVRGCHALDLSGTRLAPSGNPAVPGRAARPQRRFDRA